MSKKANITTTKKMSEIRSSSAGELLMKSGFEQIGTVKPVAHFDKPPILSAPTTHREWSGLS